MYLGPVDVVVDGSVQLCPNGGRYGARGVSSRVESLFSNLWPQPPLWHYSHKQSRSVLHPRQPSSPSTSCRLNGPLQPRYLHLFVHSSHIKVSSGGLKLIGVWDNETIQHGLTLPTEFISERSQLALRKRLGILCLSNCKL